MGRRREGRVNVELAVRIWGLDKNGQPFKENVRTGDISGAAARLTGVRSVLRVGDVIGAQHEAEKSRFRVVWVRDTGDGAFDVGVESADSAHYIWAASHQVIMQAAEVQDAGQVFAERRRDKRVACEGAAEIRRGDDEKASWGGRVSDLSAGGCYIEMPHPLPVNTEVTIALNILHSEFRCQAKVRTSHPFVGMGLLFTQVSVDDRRKLNDILASLTRGPVIKATPAPAAPPSDATTCIQQSTDELRAIEVLIQTESSRIDPRVLQEFRKAMDRARMTAWAVQQWLDLQQRKADPFSLLARLEAQRFAETVGNLREIRVEIESGTIQPDAEGVTDLSQEVDKLRRALFNFLGKAEGRSSSHSAR